MKTAHEVMLSEADCQLAARRLLGTVALMVDYDCEARVVRLMAKGTSHEVADATVGEIVPRLLVEVLDHCSDVLVAGLAQKLRELGLGESGGSVL